MAQTKRYEDLLMQAESSKPDAYQSQYGSVIGGILDKITNRQPFSYDFNADPMYQQYKDTYTKMGKEASMNAVANASALTGGYGSSYAATAGAQANQQALNGLNDVIPELYNAAMNRYNAEGQDMYNQLGALQNQEALGYSQYRDKVGDWQNDRGYLAGQLQNAITQDQWQQSYDEQVREWQDTFNYNKEQDAIANQHWQSTFDYNKERDQVADSQWQSSFDYKKEQDAIANNQWQQSFDYGKERDQVADNQWQQTFDYNKQQDAIANQHWQTQFDYGVQRDNVADQQWQSTFDYNAGRDNVADDKWQQTFDYGKQQDAISNSHWQQEFALKQQEADRDYQLALAKFNLQKQEYADKKKASEADTTAKKNIAPAELVEDVSRRLKGGGSTEQILAQLSTRYPKEVLLDAFLQNGIK